LWAGLQTVVPDGFLPAGMTLKNVMDTWTLQSGYPVINVERLYDDNSRAIITQVWHTCVLIEDDVLKWSINVFLTTL
jgi:aminopeptidase N